VREGFFRPCRALAPSLTVGPPKSPALANYSTGRGECSTPGVFVAG
jgi:hypothetical protein